MAAHISCHSLETAEWIYYIFMKIIIASIGGKKLIKKIENVIIYSALSCEISTPNNSYLNLLMYWEKVLTRRTKNRWSLWLLPIFNSLMEDNVFGGEACRQRGEREVDDAYMNKPRKTIKEKGFRRKNNRRILGPKIIRSSGHKMRS